MTPQQDASKEDDPSEAQQQVELRRCGHCRKAKPHSEFYIKAGGGDMYKLCKSCRDGARVNTARYRQKALKERMTDGE